MIAELGLAVLWMAAALAVLQLVAGILALRPEGRQIAGLVRPVAVMQGVLVAAAFAALITLFLTTDLSVKLVAENSHSMKPFIFKLAGTWGNHEGSMLLWVTIMAVAGGFVALVEKRLPENTLIATLAGQAFVSLGFYPRTRSSDWRSPRPKAQGSTRCSRTSASRSTRRRFTSAMSVSRSRSASRSARSSPAMSARRSPAPCAPGCWGPGSS